MTSLRRTKNLLQQNACVRRSRYLLPLMQQCVLFNAPDYVLSPCFPVASHWGIKKDGGLRGSCRAFRAASPGRPAAKWPDRHPAPVEHFRSQVPAKRIRGGREQTGEANRGGFRKIQCLAHRDHCTSDKVALGMANHLEQKWPGKLMPRFEDFDGRELIHRIGFPETAGIRLPPQESGRRQFSAVRQVDTTECRKPDGEFCGFSGCYAPQRFNMHHFVQVEPTNGTVQVQPRTRLSFRNWTQIESSA